MGFTSASETTSDGSAYLDAFANFRDEIRSLAREKSDHRCVHASAWQTVSVCRGIRSLLSACDRVRDSTLVDLGVRLEDRSDGTSIWKRDDPAVLKAEIAEKQALAKEQAQKKLRNKLDLKLREKERFERALELPSKYSQYDAESGYPTHDKDGKLLEGRVTINPLTHCHIRPITFSLGL